MAQQPRQRSSLTPKASSEDAVRGICLDWDAIDPPESPVRPSTSSWCLLNPEGCCQAPQTPFVWDDAVVIGRQVATSSILGSHSMAAASDAVEPVRAPGFQQHAGHFVNSEDALAQDAVPRVPAVLLSADWQQWPPPEVAWRTGRQAAQADHSMQSSRSATGPEELWCVLTGRAGMQPALGQDQHGHQEAQQAADCSLHLQQQQLQQDEQQQLQQQQALPGLPRLRSIRTQPEGGTSLQRQQALAKRAEAFMDQGWYYGRAGAGGQSEVPSSSMRERLWSWWRGGGSSAGAL